MLWYHFDKFDVAKNAVTPQYLTMANANRAQSSGAERDNDMRVPEHTVVDPRGFVAVRYSGAQP
jgi:hypothetical protein